MPYFLTRQEIYKILQRELPDNVYPQGPPSAFYSTAENDSVAKVTATAYENLERIYDNYFPQTADEKLPDWELAVFGEQLDGSLYTLAERRDLVIQRIRTRKGITVQDMIDAVKSIIGSDKNVEIGERNAHTGAWRLGASKLGKETFLRKWYGGFPNLYGPDACDRTAAEFGLTEEELLSYRRQAYLYDVRIIGYTPTADELNRIDLILKKSEPARSDHNILPNYSTVVTKKNWSLGVSKLGLNTYLTVNS